MEDRGIDRNGSRKYVAPWQGKAVTTGPLEDFELTGFPCQECPKRNDFSEAGKSHTIIPPGRGRDPFHERRRVDRVEELFEVPEADFDSILASLSC